MMDLEHHQADQAYRDVLCWGIVDVDLSRHSNRAKRINITLPARILSLVDEAAAEEHETRSGFIARVALEHIARKTGKEGA